MEKLTTAQREMERKMLGVLKVKRQEDSVVDWRANGCVADVLYIVESNGNRWSRPCHVTRI